VTDKVVDASAVAAIVYDELDRERAEEMLRDTSLFAPLLLDYEMASVCLKKIRLEPAERNGLIAAFDRFSSLPITRVANDLSETIALAIDKKLSLYDASYLWLARSLNVELITLDEKLKRAARA
jgi:predicted nucleic acid-binding protein